MTVQELIDDKQIFGVVNLGDVAQTGRYGSVLLDLLSIAGTLRRIWRG